MRRFFAALFMVWALGFLWFAAALPQPAGDEQTDAVIVPTGGPGRIAHGLEVLSEGQARTMLVTGVDPEVTPQEFAAEFEVSERQMECCVTLGFSAVDTRSNATETAEWIEDQEITSLRLVTTDWHMRRAAGELERMLPDDIRIVRDAVPSNPSLGALFLEYHKLLASAVRGLTGL